MTNAEQRNAVAELVDALVTHGVSADAAAVLVARAMIESATASPPRSSGAERTRRWRERHKASQNVTKRHDVTARESPEGVHQFLATSTPTSAATSTPTSTHALRTTPAAEAAPRRRQGHVIPTDWAPSAEDREYGRHLGASERLQNEVAEDMRIWAGANQNRSIARKADWSLTYRGFLRRAIKQAHKPNARVNGFAGIARGDFNSNRRPSDEPELLLQKH
jgi:hypothetical protein